MELTEYHVEAAIAAYHATAATRDETPWQAIVSLNGTLARLRPSLVVALSRAIELAELYGSRRGLAELDAIEGRQRLAAYPLLRSRTRRAVATC